MQPLLPTLDPKLIAQLQGKKLLLAFSAGVDSTALFFLLHEARLDCDLAIVNYHARAQSEEEVAFANHLANTFNKTLYTHDATLTTRAYENEARSIRYAFFDHLMHEHQYDMLLTAHQLNDQLEWMLMQLGKGAGFLELLGMQTFTNRQNYTVCRPLLTYSKSELQSYLDHNRHTYFLDASNEDQSIERNMIRHNFSNPLIEKYTDGIRRSFHYMQEEQERLLGPYSIRTIQDLVIIQSSQELTQVYLIDKALKERGYLLSASQRQTIKKEKSLVIGGNYAIERTDEKAYLFPYITDAVMSKPYKERCRVARIPKKLRPFLHNRGIAITAL